MWVLATTDADSTSEITSDNFSYLELDHLSELERDLANLGCREIVLDADARAVPARWVQIGHCLEDGPDGPEELGIFWPPLELPSGVDRMAALLADDRDDGGPAGWRLADGGSLICRKCASGCYAVASSLSGHWWLCSWDGPAGGERVTPVASEDLVAGTHCECGGEFRCRSVWDGELWIEQTEEA